VDKITVFARVGSDGAFFACVWDPANGQRWSWSSAVSELGWAPEPGPWSFAPAACSWDASRIDLFAVTGKPGDAIDGGTVQHTWQQDFSAGRRGRHRGQLVACGLTENIRASATSATMNDVHRGTHKGP
jgi:hypothetical protein